jgi:hypothetical protein
MDNTIIQQGRFTSTGVDVTLPLRSDVDWMMVYNISQADAAQTTALGVKYYWQRGFPASSQWVTYKSNAANAANLEEYMEGAGGFTLIDSSTQTPGALTATITAISNAAIPVVSNSGTNGLSAGDVVRLVDVTSAQQVGGMDFTVGYNTLTTGTFSLDYMAQIVAGTTGSWRKINFSPIFYPRNRYITKITRAASAVVTLSVTHGYKVGQSIRMVVPAAYGMIEMNGLLGTITAINTTTTSGNTITLDIDSSAFTAFTFPLSAAVPFSFAQTVPVGEDTASALSAGVDILSDATLNGSVIGMKLDGGASLPAGANTDIIYWVAGKSFSANSIVPLS